MMGSVVEEESAGWVVAGAGVLPPEPPPQAARESARDAARENVISHFASFISVPP